MLIVWSVNTLLISTNLRTCTHRRTSMRTKTQLQAYAAHVYGNHVCINASMRLRICMHACACCMHSLRMHTCIQGSCIMTFTFVTICLWKCVDRYETSEPSRNERHGGFIVLQCWFNSLIHILIFCSCRRRSEIVTECQTKDTYAYGNAGCALTSNKKAFAKMLDRWWFQLLWTLNWSARTAEQIRSTYQVCQDPRAYLHRPNHCSFSCFLFGHFGDNSDSPSRWVYI